MNGSGKADFVITGQWANKAYKEACKYGEANVIASSKINIFLHTKLNKDDFKDVDYFYICLNNMNYGHLQRAT